MALAEQFQRWGVDGNGYMHSERAILINNLVRHKVRIWQKTHGKLGQWMNKLDTQVSWFMLKWWSTKMYKELDI